MQFVLFVAQGGDASACLEPKFVVAAYEGADGDGLVKGSVQPDEADAASVCTAVVWLYLADELHGTYFGGAAQCTCRKGVEERADGIGVGVQRAAYPAHEVDNVAIILRFFVESYVRARAVPA